LASLRHGDWLTLERARLYGIMLSLLAIMLVVAFYAQILGAAAHDPLGRPMASDFDTFWAGARLAGAGQAVSAYHDLALRDAETYGAQLGRGQWFVYLYPPTFMLLSLPLGWLPYLAALAVFLILSCACWGFCMRALLPAPWPMLPVLAFPVGLLNLVVGQNGYVSAACFGVAALLLERRPIFAGAALGVLAYKPHLAVAVPFILVAGRRWAAFCGCAAMAFALILLSWAVLGAAAWRQFAASSAVASAMLQSREVWPKLVSVYAGGRALHAGSQVSFGVQAVCGVVALVAVTQFALRRPGGGAEIAAMAPAAMLCTPYVWDYDLVCLSIPMAWLAARGARHGWRDWEKTVLGAIYVASAGGRMINLQLGVPLLPLLIAALLVLILRRVVSDRSDVLPA